MLGRGVFGMDLVSVAVFDLWRRHLQRSGICRGPRDAGAEAMHRSEVPVSSRALVTALREEAMRFRYELTARENLACAVRQVTPETSRWWAGGAAQGQSRQIRHRRIPACRGHVRAGRAPLGFVRPRRWLITRRWIKLMFGIALWNPSWWISLSLNPKNPKSPGVAHTTCSSGMKANHAPRSGTVLSLVLALTTPSILGRPSQGSAFR